MAHTTEVRVAPLSAQMSIDNPDGVWPSGQGDQ